MVHNRHFGMTIRGHFARVYVVNNTIFDNFCDEGILAFRGMEKESWIFANNIQVATSSRHSRKRPSLTLNVTFLENPALD
jgi:hypothetical protein